MKYMGQKIGSQVFMTLMVVAIHIALSVIVVSISTQTHTTTKNRWSEQTGGQTMSDYISREALLKRLHSWADGYDKAIDLACGMVKNAPAADVAPVRRGHVVWVERPAVFAQYERHHSEDGITMYVRTCAEVKDKVPYCSECEKRLDDRFMKFCSNCGADIKEEA